MRILISLLVLCSFARADSSIEGYSYETPWLNQNSGWHAPQQIDRSTSLSSLLANLFRTNARQAFTDPTVLLGVGGAVANAAYTATATAGVATTVTNANKRIDASNARIATVETRSSNTCSKLSSLVGIADPTVSYLACTASSCSPPDAARSSTGIYTSCSTSTPSSGTADCVATNLLNTYYLSGAIGSAASTSIPATNGIGAVTTVALGKTSSGSSIHKDVALTVHDFNLFRKKVAEAINTLDKKIESILAISAPTC